jgi:hypothetical protein
MKARILRMGNQDEVQRKARIGRIRPAFTLVRVHIQALSLSSDRIHWHGARTFAALRVRFGHSVGHSLMRLSPGEALSNHRSVFYGRPLLLAQQLTQQPYKKGIGKSGVHTSVFSLHPVSYPSNCRFLHGTR